MNKKRFLMLIFMMLCIPVLCQRLTGEIWHAVLGMFLMIFVVIHICMQSGKIKYKKPAVRRVDRMLIAAMAVLALTGVLLHPLQGAFVIKILHKLSAVLFVIGTIVHVIQHRGIKNL